MKEIKLDKDEEKDYLTIMQGYKVFQSILIDLVKEGKVEMDESIAKELELLDESNQMACNHFIRKVKDEDDKTTVHIE